MLIVNVNPEKGIGAALKLLKKKVIKTKLIQEVRNRKEFVKPSAIKREEIKNARYAEKLKNNL